MKLEKDKTLLTKYSMSFMHNNKMVSYPRHHPVTIMDVCGRTDASQVRYSDRVTVSHPNEFITRTFIESA